MMDGDEIFHNIGTDMRQTDLTIFCTWPQFMFGSNTKTTHIIFKGFTSDCRGVLIDDSTAVLELL